MIAVLKSVRNQQTAIIDHITSIGAVLDYLDAHSTLRITPAMAAGISDEIWLLDTLLPLAHNA